MSTDTPREETAEGLLRSLWNDTGLRQLMRPDQDRRIARFLGERCAVCQMFPASIKTFECSNCGKHE